jgi:hypothetical protein
MIWGFHSSDYENALSGYYAMWLRSILRLPVTVNIPSLPILDTLMMEVICSSKMLILTRATWCNIPADSILYKWSLCLHHIHSSMSSFPLQIMLPLVRKGTKSWHSWGDFTFWWYWQYASFSWRCWMHLSFRMISISIWWTGLHKMCWAWDWEAVYIFGLPALAKLLGCVIYLEMATL